MYHDVIEIHVYNMYIDWVRFVSNFNVGLQETFDFQVLLTVTPLVSNTKIIFDSLFRLSFVITIRNPVWKYVSHRVTIDVKLDMVTVGMYFWSICYPEH